MWFAPSQLWLACTGVACLSSAALAFDGLTQEPSPTADLAVVAVSATPPDVAPARAASQWSRAPDGLFYVQATVNGVPVRFLVDTGASVTVLTAADAARAGVAADGAATTIATMGGDEPMRWGAIERLSLGARELGAIPTAIVVRPNGVSLLGQNVLRRMGAMSIDRDRLTLS